MASASSIGHPRPRPDERTLWDLASLTKVVGLTTAMMQLVEQHRVDLDAPLQRYIPEWTGPNKDRVTVRNLLTHTSGLPAFKAYDEITHDPDSLAKLMFSTPLDTLPGVRMVYSDIGAYMLGKLVERVTGQTLDAYVHDHVFVPLAMDETMYRPPASLLPRIAPTEFDPRRGGLVRGKVHDERAYYLGGVSAHAGIFSSGARPRALRAHVPERRHARRRARRPTRDDRAVHARTPIPRSRTAASVGRSPICQE